jgi:endonuclease YncB( thermonuclease family)
MLPELSARQEAALFFALGLAGYALIAYLTWKMLPILRATLRPLAFWRQPVVTAVHDGDTLSLSDGRLVRLIGVDTPEAHECEKLYRDASATGLPPREILRRGRHAGAIVRDLAERRRVRVRYDWRNVLSWHKGPHGRTLAYVYLLDQVGRPALMLNEEVLRRGLAVTTGHDHKYRKRFEELERGDWIGGVPRAGMYSAEDWSAGEKLNAEEKPSAGERLSAKEPAESGRAFDVEYEVVDDGRRDASRHNVAGNAPGGSPPLPGSPEAMAQTKTTEGMHEWLDRHGVPQLREEKGLLSPLSEEIRASRRVDWLKEKLKEERSTSSRWW